MATPSILERFDEAIELLEPIELFPIPKLMRGSFAGALYPNTYTATDKNRFRTYSRLAREFYHEMLSRIDEPPSLDLVHDDAYLDALPDFTGRICEPGCKFIQLEPNGDVFRCGGKDFQGNLLDGSFVRRLRAAPCNSTHCYHFCDKYVVSEATDIWTLPGQWWSRLRSSSSHR